MQEELRCYCRSNRLLGVIKQEGNSSFLHVKSHKQGKTLAEIKIHEGLITLRCISCGREHRITVRGASVEGLQARPDAN